MYEGVYEPLDCRNVTIWKKPRGGVAYPLLSLLQPHVLSFSPIIAL